jgi:hypothetical protein
MNFTYFQDKQVQAVPIDDLLRHSKVLRCFPLENVDELASALRNGYSHRAEYEFEVKDFIGGEMKKTDFYEFSLDKNLDTIWEYYLAHKNTLDDEAEQWSKNRRKQHAKYYCNHR